MGKETRTPPTARMAYQLPAKEYETLIRVGERVRMLALVSEPETPADVTSLPGTPLALSRCLEVLAAELTDVIEGAWRPEE